MTKSKRDEFERIIMDMEQMCIRQGTIDWPSLYALRQRLIALYDEATTERWIPVTERLPEFNVRVLLRFYEKDKVDFYSVAQLEPSGTWWIETWHGLDPNKNHITHWRKIEPPREEK